MNDIKVALCLSGEARTYDTGFINFKKFILDKFNVDTFISTWDSDFLMNNLECSVEKYIELYKPINYEVEQLNKKKYCH